VWWNRASWEAASAQKAVFLGREEKEKDGVTNPEGL